MNIITERFRPIEYMKDAKRQIGRQAVTHFQDYILLDTPKIYPPDFEETVQEYMKDGNRHPLVLCAHASQAVGTVAIELAAHIADISNPVLPSDRQIDGSLLLLASTMRGGQSRDVVDGLKSVAPILERYNVETLPVMREKDKHLYTYEQQQEYKNELRKKLGRVVVNNQIGLLFPEASVESGRQRPGGVPGEIKGIVALEPDAVAYAALLIRQQRMDPLIFFIGTMGENKIYDPITEKRTLSSKLTAVARSTALGRYFVPSIMSAVVDYPTPYSDLVDAYGTNGRLSPGVLDWICGERLAQLVPYEKRGVVYGEPEILDDAPHIRRLDTRSYFE